MAQRPGPGYNQLNPFSNQPQYARQYSDSDADSYTSRNASSVPLAPSGYYDGTYTPQCESSVLLAPLLVSPWGGSPPRHSHQDLLRCRGCVSLITVQRCLAVFIIYRWRRVSSARPSLCLRHIPQPTTPHRQNQSSSCRIRMKMRPALDSLSPSLVLDYRY